MIKWVIILLVALVVTIFVVRVIKVMLKTEKESNNPTPETKNDDKAYIPEKSSIDVGSATNSIVTDMSADAKNLDNVKAEYDFNDPIDNGFFDEIDADFDDYRKYARSSGGRRRMPDDFDIDGDRADEYIPDSPGFEYIPPRRNQRKKKSISSELNEMSTELKVLMLSDIFDRKHFD